jgi:hypothetical protein
MVILGILNPSGLHDGACKPLSQKSLKLTYFWEKRADYTHYENEILIPRKG